MRIVNLEAEPTEIHKQTAALLVDGFKHAWSDMTSAMQEVEESFVGDVISRVAVYNNTVIGWIGARSQYDGHVWELHPLVVHADHRRKGIGRALVFDIEVQVRERGGLTLWLGTDDEDNGTTLAGADLYPNVLQHLANIESLRDHPFRFYQKLGFEIVGVMPDANGFGRPDIYMAKRVRSHK